MSSPSDILSKIPDAFDKALGTGDLLFFPSTVVKHNEEDIEFQVRVCPALLSKPRSSTTPHSNIEVPRDSSTLDPFAPPYNPHLHVGDLRDDRNDEEYVILLNKYSLVPQHFLLVTKEYRAQTAPLTPSELLQTYLILSEARKAGKPYFAFFNCGKNSGASQPHKHIQFIPVDSDNGPPIEEFARSAKLETSDTPFSLSKLSHANHVFRFPNNLTSLSAGEIETVLSDAFLSLLDLAISTIRHEPSYPAGSPSYNVIITSEHMHLIPRSREFYVIPETGDEISINSLGYAGMFVVASEKELDALRKEKIGKILCEVGLKNVEEILLAGISQDVS